MNMYAIWYERVSRWHENGWYEKMLVRKTRLPAEAAHRAEHQLTASETTFIRQTQPANSSLAELQRRFPTVSRGRATANRGPVSKRYERPNSTSWTHPIIQNVRHSSTGI